MTGTQSRDRDFDPMYLNPLNPYPYSGVVHVPGWLQEDHIDERFWSF